MINCWWNVVTHSRRPRLALCFGMAEMVWRACRTLKLSPSWSCADIPLGECWDGRQNWLLNHVIMLLAHILPRSAEATNAQDILDVE